MAADPRLARIRPKLDRASGELERLDRFLAHLDDEEGGAEVEWGKVVVVAASLANVYNGMEDVMADIAKSVDGAVPTGDAWHADLIDQMSVPVDEVRPALLGRTLVPSMIELKGFRHLVRHKYGIEPRARETFENLALMRTTLPAFVEAVDSLVLALSEQPPPPTI